MLQFVAATKVKTRSLRLFDDTWEKSYAEISCSRRKL